MTKTDQKIALVTGANQGLGFELCRQLAQKGLKVLLTARDPKKGRASAKLLQDEGLDVEFHELDVTQEGTIDRAYKAIEGQYGRVDFLINNAGAMLDHAQHGGPVKKAPEIRQPASIFEAELDTIRKSLETNTFGAILMAQKFVPMMLRNGFGRIVNVSSGMGQLSEMNGGWPGYRISKTALNAVTRILADELADSPITAVSICPGWVKTRMGGKDAEMEISEAVQHITKTVLEDRQNGVFLRFGERIEW